MPTYGKIGPYKIYWQYGDNKESIHVHIALKDTEVGKIWLSVKRNAIIVEYAPKDIDVAEVAKIILAEPTYSNIQNDWLLSRNNVPFTYIDGRKYNSGTYVFVSMEELEELSRNSDL